MVKIERPTRMGCFRQMFLCNGKRLFINLYKIYFINSTPLYFIVKWLNFLLITCTSYFIKYLKHFLLLPILAY